VRRRWPLNKDTTMKTTHRNASRAKRQARILDKDLVNKVLSNVTKLTPGEVAQAITPMREAMLNLKRRTATEANFVWITTCAHMGLSIERQGVVRGLAQHFEAAMDACRAIDTRARTTGQWCSPCLHGSEIETLDTAIDLHEYQLQQLSYGEFIQASDNATLRTRSTGGVVVYAEDLQA
jgi:hypothetical protein